MKKGMRRRLLLIRLSIITENVQQDFHKIGHYPYLTCVDNMKAVRNIPFFAK